MPTKKKVKTRPETLTSVDPALNPAEIFKRGYITKAESEAVDLNKFASKVNLKDQDGDAEGIWAAFLTLEDKAKYESSQSRGEKVRAILLNHAVCFFPNPTWGRVIEGTTNGDKRPEFLAADQIDRLMATHTAYSQEFPQEPPQEKNECPLNPIDPSSCNS